MNSLVKFELDKFNTALKQYIRISKLTLDDAILKQSKKLVIQYAMGLKPLTPAPGEITTERLRMLKQIGGIKIRPGLAERVAIRYKANVNLEDRKLLIGRRKKQAGTVRLQGQDLNLQALIVRAELRARERGRGFTPYSASIKNLDSLKTARSMTHSGRYGQELAHIDRMTTADQSAMIFKWGGGGKSDIGRSLKRPKAQTALQHALQFVSHDMNMYIEPRLERLSKQV